MTHYYLVDANIIISYINRESLAIVAFVDDPRNKFFYTETVKKEVTKCGDIPPIFKYHESGLPERRKELAHQKLVDTSFINLTPKQITNFKNDILIIFEAGYSSDILPLDDFTEPYLLTNNLVLYKKFISNPINQKKLEDVINLYGLEHLIEVIRPSGAI